MRPNEALPDAAHTKYWRAGATTMSSVFWPNIDNDPRGESISFGAEEMMCYWGKEAKKFPNCPCISFWGWGKKGRYLREGFKVPLFLLQLASLS